MSHYLIEQIAALPNVEVRTRLRRRSRAEGDDGHLRALRIRDARRRGDASRTVDAVLRLHRRRAAHRLARGRRRARRARLHPRRRRRQGGRLAAQARPVPARDERAGRVRRRRRARALDQARGERGRRGLDGGLADPRVPGAGMSTAAITAADLRPRRPVRRPRRRRSSPSGRRSRRAATLEPGDLLARAGRAVARAAAAARGHGADACMVDDGRSEPVGRQERADVDRRDRGAHRRPAAACACGATTACRVARHPARRLPPRSRSRSRVGAPRASCSADRPGDDAADRRRAEPRAARRRSARWRPGSRTSSTTRPRPPSAPRRDLADALEVDQRHARRVRRGGHRARRTPSGSCACSARRSSARAAHDALDALDAADAEDAMLERLEDLGVAGGLAPRRAAGGAPASTTLAGAGRRELAGPATGAALRWVAASLTARSLAASC